MARLDVVGYLIAHLQTEFPNVHVEASIPADRPERLIVVQRATGHRTDVLQDRAGVFLLVYGGTNAKTAQLATSVGDSIYGLRYSDSAFADGIADVEEVSLRNDPDTVTEPDTPRWFGHYTVTTHAY